MLEPRPHRAFLAATTTLLCGLASGQTAQQAAVLVTAQVSTSPPQITFTWPSDPTATGYTVSRRPAGTTTWGPASGVPGGSTATSWIDSVAVVGQRYEYLFVKAGNPQGKGFLTSGIDADAIEQRGKLVLLVDASVAGALATKLDRLTEDLVGDGWVVLRHDVQPTQSVPSVKALIVADVLADPGAVKAVFLLGHVPVPYSGSIYPDGHPDHQGAWAADVYYGDFNGTWTDSSVNITTATRPENRNVPGDGKFDQSSLPSDVDLQVGRVDLANMPSFGLADDVLLANYLDKDHDYRHKVFAVDQRGVIDDNFGYFTGEAFAATAWRAFSALLGPANSTSGDYFTTLNTTSGNGYAWSYGCGGGTYTSAGGIGSTSDFTTSTNRNVFTMLFGSYFGDWDSTDNFLRAPLCSGWTLADVWAGRPHWSFHPMGMGETIGACARLSQNDTTAGGYGARSVHIALMGDPTLRQHVIAPPASVAVVDAWPQASVTWDPSSDPVAGYHVYRAATPAGPFVRLSGAVVAGTAFTDPSPVLGYATYMVRAVRLETTPSGTYWNLSQGSFATTCLPQGAASHTSYGAGCYTIPPNISALQLGASPAPVSTPTAGTLLTYTIDNIPEAAPGSGVYLGVTIVSWTPDLAGTSLAFLDMPGCSLYVGSLDLTLAFVGNSASLTTQFQLPAGVACGTQFYATAAALFVPNSLPNGANGFGAVTSNGVASFVAPY
ncbi:MAG TPA: fibronectin type III domain-containing protein [Planctomycetota bacterium]|nr:fibronectin type III domain-containing protein [Planctomycetota bacterium]